MLFGNRKGPSAASRATAKSVLSDLFVPDISSNIRPLEETTSLFVRLIASIFAANGLFPKDHPMFTNPTAQKMTLSQIIRAAWTRLTFNREGSAQVVLFFAVAGTIVFSALTILIVFLLMFIGNAHAADTYFTPPDNTNDLAINLLDFLFKGKISTNFSDAGVMAQNTALQTALITVLGFFSSAILICASFILFYHLVSMVVETAHHGVPMGKRANQIWAPIRLVFAIGLLVPVSTNGLNSGQYIAIQVAEWGSGLASQVWSKFVTSFAQASYAIPPSPYVHNLGETVLNIEACILMINYELPAINTYGVDNTFQIANYDQSPLTDTSALPDGTTRKFQPIDTGGAHSGTNNCGTIVFATTPQNGNSTTNTFATSVSSAQRTAVVAAFDTAKQELSPYLTPVTDPNSLPPTRYFIGDNFAFPDDTDNSIKGGDFVTAVSDAYKNSLNTSLAALAQNGPVSSIDTNSWTSLGWIAAGAYFNKIARQQGDLENAIFASMPQLQGPAIDDAHVQARLWADAKQGLHNLENWYNRTLLDDATYTQTATPTTLTHENGLCDQTVLQAAQKGVQWASDVLDQIFNHPDDTADSVKNTVSKYTDDITSSLKNDNIRKISSHSIVDVGARMADYAAQLNCVWTPKPAYFDNDTDLATTLQNGADNQFLGVTFKSANPFVEMVRLGYGNLNAAYFLVNFLFVVQAASGFKVLSALSLVASVISFIALLFFACGFLLAYFLPLIPFITFLLNGLTWVAMVLESVVMMPLVALAHLNPEGDGLPGQNARNAYFYLFAIFLRPVMMIFGLIVGWLLFIVGVILMNKLYMIAVSGALAIDGTAHIFVSRLVYSILYVALLYMVCHKSFNMVGSLPNHAMQWIGAADAPKEPFGSADSMGSVMGTVSTVAGQQVITSIGEGGKGIAGMISGHRTNVTTAQTQQNAISNGWNDMIRKGTPTGLDPKTVGRYIQEGRSYNSLDPAFRGRMTQGQYNDLAAQSRHFLATQK